jgi:flagellin-like protein
MIFKKVRRNVKAISPVISVLLMIAIAVVASLVTYAWVMGYIGFTSDKASKAIQIQSVANQEDGTHVYLQNVGNSPVTFATPLVYTDGAGELATPVAGSGFTGTNNMLASGATGDFLLGTTIPNDGIAHIVKVASDDGTFSQVSVTFPQS